MERVGNERVANVQQNTGDEGARVQYQAGIASDQSEPEHDKEVLGNEC